MIANPPRDACRSSSAQQEAAIIAWAKWAGGKRCREGSSGLGVAQISLDSEIPLAGSQVEIPLRTMRASFERTVLGAERAIEGVIPDLVAPAVEVGARGTVGALEHVLGDAAVASMPGPGMAV